MRIRILLLAFLMFGCGDNKKTWIPLLSSQQWYQDIKGDEKMLSGKIYDKGVMKWIVKGDFKAEKGVISDEALKYQKGEEYNRFLFKPWFTSYDLYLGDFWVEEKMVEILKLNNPEEAKRLGEKKFEIIGKEMVFFVKAGERTIKKKDFAPGMIRMK